MKLLFDECVPRKVKFLFADSGHECETVRDAGFSGKENGDLLDLAEGHFDVLVTIDGSSANLSVSTFRLRDSLSECNITGRCLPAMTPRVLVMGDEVRTEENFFRSTITINSFTGRSLSARLQGSLRLLPFPLPASPSVPSSDGLSHCEERYGLTLFR